MKAALDFVVPRICGGYLPDRTVEDFAKPGKQLVLGSFGSYLTVDLFTANREFDFCEAFSRIAVEVVDGIPARVASESDLKILGLTDRSALARPSERRSVRGGLAGLD